MTAVLDAGLFCARCGLHRVVTPGQLCPVCADDDTHTTRKAEA